MSNPARERRAAGYLLDTLPEVALSLSFADIRAHLTERYEEGIDAALTGATTGPARDVAKDTSWMRSSNVVGINVRTVGSFWKVIPYVLTLPPAFDSVHLLPIWEPGVVGSLYGIASWEINNEFFDVELFRAVPSLRTAAAQLAAVVNLLHLTGHRVGMDVIPHTDRYSEIVLAQPSHFEWLRRKGTTIVDHRADLHEEVEAAIDDFLHEHGSADPGVVLPAPGTLFEKTTEEARTRLLFGVAADRKGRTARRIALIKHLHGLGYEPLPATMAPPYRGLEVDTDIPPTVADDMVWYEYRITHPEAMSRVFGPLTRYKLYERKDDNRNWEIDFLKPRERVWDYVTERYDSVRRHFGFDFVRGDMSHVQMRPEGVPAETDDYYDIFRAVKARAAADNPSFAYFAESFLSPAETMGYGDEIDHLEASHADVTLGDLQSLPVATEAFSARFRTYLDIAATRGVVPSFTVMTGDKDDPRFDSFYLEGNEFRYFCALFLVDLPSYMALGFRVRDPHPEPVSNEYYTKLYVFHEDDGPKATTGPYRFGGNTELYRRIARIGNFAETILPHVGSEVTWLLPPSATGTTPLLAWLLEDTADTEREYLCIASTGIGGDFINRRIPLRRVPIRSESDPQQPASSGAGTRRRPKHRTLLDPPLLFSTEEVHSPAPLVPVKNKNPALLIPHLADGECRVYEIRR